MLKDFSLEYFDIIILAGQSNSEGYGFGGVENPYEPNEQVWYMEGNCIYDADKEIWYVNGEFTISRAAEKVFGNELQSTYALSFAREYINSGLLKEGRKLLILRTAVGGTGFLNNQWKMTDVLYLRMMEMIADALALNKNNRLVGLLWHQGETDVDLGASYEIHYYHLMKLLCSVRDEFHVPRLPFIAGDFAHYWKVGKEEKCAPVIDAIRDVCKDCGYGAFVETDGLLSNFEELNRNTLGWKDDVHFSRKSCYILGKRYFEAFCRIEKED